MTATGPDKGTPGKQTTKHSVTQNKYLRSSYMKILGEIRNPAPWEVLEEETMDAIAEIFGPPDKKTGMRYNTAIVSLAKATGGIPKDEENMTKFLRLVAPIIKGPGVEMVMRLHSCMGALQALNVAEKSQKGKITPELAAILNDTYELTEELRRLHVTGERSLMLAYLIDEKKIDFSPYRGKGDTGADWYFDYRIGFSPLPTLAGTPPATLGAMTKGAGTEYVATISHYKALARQCLTGIKPTEEMLKRAGVGIKENNVDNDGYIIAPVEPEALLMFAEALEMQYQRRQRERTRKDYAAPFTSRREAGFYVNPVTCKVYDLRPYTKELHTLFSVKSWRYLKDAAAAIREAVADFKGEGLPAKKEEQRPTSIFDNAFIKMFNATPINSLININTSKSGRPEAETGYFEQNMFTKEWEYKKGGTELNMPVKHGDGGNNSPLFTTSTAKTIHFISLLFTAQNSAKHQENIFPVVDTSVREYMLATGRKITTNSVKDTTKTMKRDLDTMADISLRSNDKKYSLSRVNPFAETHINRGKIRVVLAPTFAEFLVKTTGFLMNYPAALLKLKENNSNLFPLGFKLALNRSNDANIRKGKANILSVPVCLECCPGIPTIERVRKEGKGYSPVKRIVEPFEKTLDALQEQGVLAHWEYCLPKGEPLGQPAVTDYNYFVSLYILYEIKDFPIGDELPRIQATAEKRQKRKERIERYTDQAIARQKAKDTAADK